MTKTDGMPTVDYIVIGLRFIFKVGDWFKDIFFLTVFTHKTLFASIFIGTFSIAPMTFMIL